MGNETKKERKTVERMLSTNFGNEKQVGRTETAFSKLHKAKKKKCLEKTKTKKNLKGLQVGNARFLLN